MMDVDGLRRDIITALNRSGADAACHIPDFELAEVLVSQVQAIGVAVRQSIKQGYDCRETVRADEIKRLRNMAVEIHDMLQARIDGVGGTDHELREMARAHEILDLTNRSNAND